MCLCSSSEAQPSHSPSSVKRDKTAVEVGDWGRDKATQKHIVIWNQVYSWKFFILSILQKKEQSLIDEFL